MRISFSEVSRSLFSFHFDPIQKQKKYYSVITYAAWEIDASACVQLFSKEKKKKKKKSRVDNAIFSVFFGPPMISIELNYQYEKNAKPHS